MPGIGIGTSPAFNRGVGGGEPAPAVIGDIVTPTYVSGDYTDSNGNVSHSIVGGRLRISGTDAAVFGKFVTFDLSSLTDRENVTLKIFNYQANVSATSIGIGPCLTSTVNGSLYQHIGVIGLEQGVNKGNLYVMDTTGGSSMILDQTNPDAAFVDNLDNLEIYINRNVNVITVTAKNLTKAVADKVISFPYVYGATNAVSLIVPAAAVGFYFFGGVHDFEWQAYTNEYNRADLVGFGESKVVGYSVGGTNPADTIGGKLRASNPGKIIYIQAGANETTNDMVARLDDLELSRPKKVSIFSLSNDLRFGVSAAVTQANLNTIRNRVESWGGEFSVWNPFLEIAPNGIDQTPLIATMAAVVPALTIYSYTTFDPNTGTSADGVHLNTTGTTDAVTDINSQIW